MDVLTSTWIILLHKLLQGNPATTHTNHDCVVEKSHQTGLLLLSKLSMREQNGCHEKKKNQNVCDKRTKMVAMQEQDDCHER